MDDFLFTDDFEKHNLTTNVIASGAYVGIGWCRPEDEPVTSEPDETIKSIHLSDRILPDKSSGMELSIYFDHAINTNPDPDEEPEAWQGEQKQVSGPRCSGKERLVTEAIMKDIIEDQDTQIAHDPDACNIIRFQGITALTAAKLLHLLADKFDVNSSDMKIMSRAAELPVPKP